MARRQHISFLKNGREEARDFLVVDITWPNLSIQNRAGQLEPIQHVNPMEAIEPYLAIIRDAIEPEANGVGDKAIHNTDCFSMDLAAVVDHDYREVSSTPL